MLLLSKKQNLLAITTKTFNGENGGYADETASRTKIACDANNADLETVGLKAGFAFLVRSRSLVEQSLQRCTIAGSSIRTLCPIIASAYAYGKYFMQGMTSEGIKFEMRIGQSSDLKTAYSVDK